MTMFQLCARGSVLLACASALNIFAQTTNNTLTGQWDFNQGDLRATNGAPLQYLGDTATNTIFETVAIGGTNANVMRFPAASPSQGYLLIHGAAPNGGGTNVNLYTLVLDLMWPSESDGAFRALFNADTNNLEDAVMFVNPDNGVGVNNDYAGTMAPDTWYRLGLSFNLTNSTVTKVLIGGGETNLSTQILEAGVDSRYSLEPALLLFTDNDGETRSGLVDRIQFYSEALTEEQLTALGTPMGDGGPAVTGDVKIDDIRKVGNDVQITVSGGGTLQLQRKAKLTDAEWQPAGQVTGSGTLTVPSTEPTGFFRVARI